MDTLIAFAGEHPYRAAGFVIALFLLGIVMTWLSTLGDWKIEDEE